MSIAPAAMSIRTTRLRRGYSTTRHTRANCQSNCEPRSYSFSNLGSGAAPPVWAAQVCGFFLGCPAIEPDYVKIAEDLRELDAAADAEAATSEESRVMTAGPSLVKGNEPAIAAKKEKFCRDIQMMIVEAKAVRRRKIRRSQKSR